jgi:hypothetical protein
MRSTMFAAMCSERVEEKAGASNESVAPRCGKRMAQQHVRNVLAYLEVATVTQSEVIIQVNDRSSKKVGIS